LVIVHAIPGPPPAGTRLRILHTDTDDLENPLRGGQPVRTFAVNSRLAARHEITVLTSVYPGCRRRLSRNGVAYRRLGLRLPGFGLSPHLSFLARLGPAVRALEHDLVVEEFTPPVGFCGLPWWTQKPVVLVVQWYFFAQWERRYHLPFARWMRALARRERYRHVIVQSEAMRREVAPLFPRAKIRVIPCGLDDDAFVASAATQHAPGRGLAFASPTETAGTAVAYVLFLGRLDLEHKGLDLLMQAWRETCVGAQVPLILAGEGPARGWLEAFINRANLGPLVTLAGRVEGPAKTRLLAGARLVVMPSRYETFGITALEAMAASRPLVCFDIPHLNELARAPWAELITRSGDNPTDAAALGQAVLALWGQPEHARAMGARGHAQAQAYRWDAIARQQEEFYREALSDHYENA
jgi:glycosyltransferase involved in cell wall biosynthesis